MFPFWEPNYQGKLTPRRVVCVVFGLRLNLRPQTCFLALRIPQRLINLHSPQAVVGAEGAGEFGRASEAEADLAGKGGGNRDDVSWLQLGQLTRGDFHLRQFGADG